MSRVFSLTGGIASGKSTISNLLRDRGIAIVDADVIAREVVVPGTPGLQAIVGAFGADVLQPDGTLDRKKLGRVVFSDTDALRRLDEALGPFLLAEISKQITEFRRVGRDVCLDAATLVERNLHTWYRPVVLVAASRDTQIERLKIRNSLTAAEAALRIDSQTTIQRKIGAADHVIWNSGTFAELEGKVLDVLDHVMQPATLEEVFAFLGVHAGHHVVTPYGNSHRAGYDCACGATVEVRLDSGDKIRLYGREVSRAGVLAAHAKANQT